MSDALEEIMAQPIDPLDVMDIIKTEEFANQAGLLNNYIPFLQLEQYLGRLTFTTADGTAPQPTRGVRRSE